MIVEETYKDSGVNWIGIIPKSWRIIKLKYLKSDDESSFVDGDWIESDVIVENGIRYITSGNIGVGSYKEQGNGHITDDTFNELKCTELFPGDLIISRLFLPVGRSCILPDLGKRVVMAVDNVVLRPKNKYHVPFLNYYFNNHRYAEYNNTNARGSTLKRISRTILGNNPVVIPDFDQQKSIASFLDQKTELIDALIAKKERMIDLLEEQRQATINQAVTCGLDENGNLREQPESLPAPGWKDSGVEWIGAVPEDWEVIKLKFLTDKIGSGVTPKGGAESYQSTGIPLLRSQNIHFDGLKLKDVAFIDVETHNKMSGSKVLKGDILFNITGASIGRCYYMDDQLTEANVNQHVCIVRPSSMSSTKFLYYYLRSEFGQMQVEMANTGSGREGLNFENLKSFYVTVPSQRKHQEAVACYLENEDSYYLNLIKIQVDQIDLLKEYKSSLIFNAVTGKIQVDG